VEISNRTYPDEYDLVDYLGISMNVMKLEFMFSHKLMALLDRNALTNRDVFDCWHCMQQRIMLRRSILELRLTCSFEDYMDQCIEAVSGIHQNRLLDGMGELLDPELKHWVKANLAEEFITLARMYRDVPLIK
jgi:predicted nucleotidyltransferase component of viral defense system